MNAVLALIGLVGIVVAGAVILAKICDLIVKGHDES